MKLKNILLILLMGLSAASLSSSQIAPCLDQFNESVVYAENKHYRENIDMLTMGAGAVALVG